MPLKQVTNSLQAPDGSHYVTLTDGGGNLGGVYPSGATPVTATTVGASTGSLSVSLPGVAGKTTYISGFFIGANATAATSGTASVTGTVSGTINFLESVAASPAVGSLSQTFNPAIPASAVNTAIMVFSAAPGAGGNQAISAWGYQL